MNTLILIPARKGSVRLKNKNKKNFLGKPLVFHSIQFAKKIKILKKILISTDDPKILLIGKKFKVLAPWLRPKEISTSKSKSISFAFHALKWVEKNYKEPDTIILLQPTSPFRSINTLKGMLKLYRKNKKSVVTVTTKLRKNKKILYFLNNKFLKKEKKLNDKNVQAVNIVGNTYINSVKNLKKYRDFVNKETIPYLITNSKELVDIDTPKDFNKAIKLS